ncbi:MAG: pectate lyase, partial [Verrucomicrobiaceae bacterium]|nr:pectate lyase [Verrucomicrobiaceae bacterium]
MMKALLPVLLFSALAHAEPTPWRWQEDRVPDLGFDLDAAQVIKVTSLETKGKGTLREALLAKGPRIVVFEVAGVIDLDLKGLKVDEPQLIVAGQTAPSPGITLIRGTLQIQGSQTLIQHLHVRPGDAGQAKGTWDPDGMTTSGGPQEVWFDHCSCTWSIDENLSATTYKSPTGEPTRRVYMRDCLIAEALNNSTHHKGPHSKGTLVDAGTQEVAIVRCLYSSNVERNPVIHPGTSAVIVNTVIANPGERAIHSNTSQKT